MLAGIGRYDRYCQVLADTGKYWQEVAGIGRYPQVLAGIAGIGRLFYQLNI